MRTIVSCVGENDDQWFAKMRNLVLSVRAFGGGLARSRIVVNIVGGARPDYVRALDDLDAEVRVVQPMDPRQPSSNKLRMLELAGDEDFDVLVMLDCDVIVRGDLTNELDLNALRAAPAGKNHLSDQAWGRLYRDLDLAVPEHRTTMAVSGTRCFPYFNTGVLFVPWATCGPLRMHWGTQMARVLDLADADPTRFAFRKDQVPFACALVSAGLELDLLPVNLNLSTTPGRMAGAYRDQRGPPFILHYHRSLDAAGFLHPSPVREINDHLDEFNRRLAEHLGVPYDGIGSVPLLRKLRLTLNTRPWYWQIKRRYRGARRRYRQVRRRGSRPSTVPPSTQELG